jgi:hypothetical protein
VEQAICQERCGNRDYLWRNRMKLVFLLEEQSMKTFLDGILPRILPPDVTFITVPHEGKTDLQKSIPIKLRAWKQPDVKFVIVQDQDTGDCREIKRKIAELCQNTKQEVLIRIACHELEAWYFGDLEAVSKAYSKNLKALANKKQYRIPDAIICPKRELKKYLPEHQQISGAKLIAQYIDINNNKSESFQTFVSGVKRLIS